jgi:hypothetical protein
VEPQLSERSIAALEKIITGDIPTGHERALAPYMNASKLVEFFNQFGIKDTYPSRGGFPSRWAYTQENLRFFNGTSVLPKIIAEALSPARYLDSNLKLSDAIDHLNKYLEYDDLKVSLVGRRCCLFTLGGLTVQSESTLSVQDPVSHQFIQEQLIKCDDKIAAGDFDGAITNARSLVEAIVYELEGRLDSARPAYDGDLPRLYKRLQKLLNLSSERNDISNSLKSVLSGLQSIVSGLAPMRNKMGDAHVRTYRTERHHAKLAVNSAKTLTDFLIDTYEYQQKRGTIP